MRSKALQVIYMNWERQIVGDNVSCRFYRKCFHSQAKDQVLFSDDLGHISELSMKQKFIIDPWAFKMKGRMKIQRAFCNNSLQMWWMSLHSASLEDAVASLQALTHASLLLPF